MNDMPSALHAIQEYFVSEHRSRAERADALCDLFASKLAALEIQLGAKADDQAMLTDLWPLFDLRDAMTLATREMLNVDGEATIAFAKHKHMRAAPYARNVTLVTVDQLEKATRQVDRLAAKLAKIQPLQ